MQKLAGACSLSTSARSMTIAKKALVLSFINTEYVRLPNAILLAFLMRSHKSRYFIIKRVGTLHVPLHQINKARSYQNYHSSQLPIMMDT
jgi:hypothetical protein